MCHLYSGVGGLIVFILTVEKRKIKIKTHPTNSAVKFVQLVRPKLLSVIITATENSVSYWTIDQLEHIKNHSLYKSKSTSILCLWHIISGSFLLLFFFSQSKTATLHRSLKMALVKILQWKLSLHYKFFKQTHLENACFPHSILLWFQRVALVVS